MGNLPPLPQKVQIDKHIPSGYVILGYTADQMHAYARAVERAHGITATPAAHRQWVCGKCGTDRFIAACPHGHGAALTGQCPMVGTAAKEQP